MNGEKRIQAESFIVYGWFEAVFQSEEQMDTLVRTSHVSSTDIGMEFGKLWNSYHEERGNS